MGVATWLFRASWAVASLWRAQSHLLLSDHTIGLITVQCQEQNGKHPTIFSKLHSAAHWSATQQGGSAIQRAERATQNGLAVYWRKGWKTKKKIPHILKSHHASLSLSSRYCCNLSHSYLILQEFPARLMCYWFQVSCYWNGGGPWEGGRGSRTTGSESKRLKEEKREREKMEFCQRHYSIYPAHITYLIIYSIKSMISN